MFAFDQGSDGVSDLSTPRPELLRHPIPERGGPVHPGRLTSHRDGLGRAEARGGAGPVRTLNFPNFPSSSNTVTAQFDDFEH